MNDSARKEANLKLLKRTCGANIQDILATATHVVLYEFAGGAWNKLGVEGSLFLTISTESYDCIILNRHTPNNFTLSVTKDLQLQHQEPYLIIKVPATSQVLGIWFPSAEERQIFYDCLQRTLEQLRQPVTAQGSIHARPAKIDHEATALLAHKLLMNVNIAPAETLNNNAAPAPPPDAPNRTAAANTPAASATPPRHGSPGGVALDKKSLQLALLSLIQDDRFLDLLHSQYLRVVHARAKPKQQDS
jgi:mRNA-decapping enzyme 1B